MPRNSTSPQDRQMGPAQVHNIYPLAPMAFLDVWPHAPSIAYTSFLVRQSSDFLGQDEAQTVSRAAAG